MTKPQKKKILPPEEALNKAFDHIYTTIDLDTRKQLIKSLIQIQGMVSSIATMLEEANFSLMESAIFWGSLEHLRWQEFRQFYCEPTHQGLNIIKMNPESAKAFVEELVKDAKRSAKEN